ncbi:Predicted RNA-binding protein [Acetitomaculum ruminis DSM 5522]|uniref:Predicted RNA-binding protein n=1 Tax=Acetitomaculum ruminis DSM 5522 TaxID=1120918 RepID=A0A1I1ACT9_9FIRM|nr:CooT family nickel-binding protein [Acetitomaculum ruminis]SFB35825.1 Predicted RNA-binding protein [Acetitomaculum ruminis DSM 5522]
MCLATAFRKTQSPDKMICENISKIFVDGDKITMVDIIGEEIVIEGKISMVDLSKSIVLIDPLD